VESQAARLRVVDGPGVANLRAPAAPPAHGLFFFSFIADFFFRFFFCDFFNFFLVFYD
jgi:hypothetical protein